MVVLFSIDGLILCARDVLQVCKGYVFTGVCLSTVGERMAGDVCGGVCTWWGCAWQGEGACVAGGMHGRGHTWQESQLQQQAVRILLECILINCVNVGFFFLSTIVI